MSNNLFSTSSNILLVYRKNREDQTRFPLAASHTSIWQPASDHGARESACAGLINQLQRFRFDPRIACLENTDTATVGDWWTGMVGHHALNCELAQKMFQLGSDLLSATDGLSEFHSDINKIHVRNDWDPLKRSTINDDYLPANSLQMDSTRPLT